MSLDSSDSETQPEEIFTTKDTPALESKVQLIETQTMSPGFENLGSLFLTSNGTSAMDDFLLVNLICYMLESQLCRNSDSCGATHSL